MPASPYDDDISTTGPIVVDSPLPRGCQKCGETESQVYTVIDGKDYCRTCLAMMRLEEFHRIVTRPGDQ